MRVLGGAPQAQLHWHEMHASWHKAVVSEVNEKVQYLRRVNKKKIHPDQTGYQIT